MPPGPTAASARRRSYRVVVDAELCDGCGICVFFCKPAVFELSRELGRRGFFPAAVRRGEACNGCDLCVLGCPQLAVAVEEAAS